MRSFAALLILTAYARAAEPPPQCTLPAPQDMLAFGGPCACPSGGPCSCPAGKCDCAGCTCAKCPGLPDGVAPTREGALASCRQYACPLVGWINLSPRSVKGAVGYHETGQTDTRPRVVVWTERGGVEELSAKVTDADVAESAARCQRQTVNTALAPPPMYGPQFMGGYARSFGCAGGNCH